MQQNDPPRYSGASQAMKAGLGPLRVVELYEARMRSRTLPHEDEGATMMTRLHWLIHRLYNLSFVPAVMFILFAMVKYSQPARQSVCAPMPSLVKTPFRGWPSRLSPDSLSPLANRQRSRLRMFCR